MVERVQVGLSITKCNQIFNTGVVLYRTRYCTRTRLRSVGITVIICTHSDAKILRHTGNLITSQTLMETRKV